MKRSEMNSTPGQRSLFASTISTGLRFLAATRRSSQLFLDSLAVTYPTQALLAGAAIFVATLAAYAAMTPNALVNGDAAVYVQQIARRDFSRITVHTGYYALGVLFTKLLPVGKDYAINLMNCCFGALTVFVVYLLGFSLSRTHAAAVASAAFVATSYVFIYNSIYAEVYLPQIFFLILALLLWLHDRAALSGLSFAMSVLVTPTSILAVPFFAALRPRGRQLLVFLVAALVPVALVALPHFRDYVYSDRGLLLASRYPFRPDYALGKQGLEMVMGPIAYVPFVAIGMMQLNRKELRILLGAMVSLWTLTFLLVDVTPDVPVHLPTYVLLCLVAGLGFQRFMGTRSGEPNKALLVALAVSAVSACALILAIKTSKSFGQISMGVPISLAVGILIYGSGTILLRRANGRRIRSVATLGVLAFFLAANGSFVIRETAKVNRILVEFRDTVLELNRTASPGYLVVSEWSQGILFEHYAFGTRYTGSWLRVTWLEEDWGMKMWTDAINAGREIWLLEEYPSLLLELRDAGYAIEPFRGTYRAVKS